MVAATRERHSKLLATGAVLGAVGAIAGAFAGYHLRRELGKRLDIPDPAVAIVEDMIAVGGSIALVRRGVSMRAVVSRGRW